MASSRERQPRAAATTGSRHRSTGLLPGLAVGAVVAALALVALRFGVHELWSPFDITGGKVFRALVFSGLAAGVATALAGRGNLGPRPAAACALGWGVWGFCEMHLAHPGTFGSFWPPGANFSTIDSPDIYATGVFLGDAQQQPICVAFGLLLASVAGWMVDRRRYARARDGTAGTGFEPGRRPAPGGDDSEEHEAASTAFARALSFPLLLAVVGLAGISLLGVVFRLPPPLGAGRLPAPAGYALLGSAASAGAFGLASALLRRGLRDAGTIGYAMAAPLVVTFVGFMLALTRGQIALLRPAGDVLWYSSPFEVAVWGAFGSICGYWAGGDPRA